MPPKAPDEIKELVEKFHRNLEAYKNPSYKEEQLKQEFINPFFKALGWDVDNVSGAAPQYRDVIFEDSIKVGGGTKAPDYCFTLAGRKMFFVEAKKPSVNVKMSIEPSYQLRRYAWSAKLPLSILTDFEELAVYDSRTKPQKKDSASTGRIMFLTYQDYLEKWDDIYSIFSREAVLQGSFDKFAESTKKKRGTTEVDDAFLSEIEEWRDLFAKNIALRNPEITIDELNYAVQQIIDRLVFLRMCEDRGVEKYEQLRNLLDNNDIYQHFGELCLKADEKYNSGLFHFKEEKNRETPPDKLTLDLNIDDRVFKTIIKNLYYPNSPYEFSVLSPEILGNVYEQFLGKVIRLTPGHQAKIEEKPEVKKAGGVYYTPQFIVDYIVENTVGKLCKGKTPNKVSKLRILDPACGSGSFLLGAYTYLLKWHRDYYTDQKDKKRLENKIYQGKGGEYYLTIREKKRILLNNIYGVDIDPQAVNVTKLSLLLKVLEGENRDALEAQKKLFRERALPDLGNNIKCGNSLIEPDIYEDPDLSLSGGDIQRINPFEWKSEFSNVMDNGGFDAVIGNPPYLRIQGLQEYYGNQIRYFVGNYESAVKRFDIYLLFIEKGYRLLNHGGFVGFICPHKFLNSDFGSGIRQFLINNSALSSFTNFGNNLIFKKASTYTGILLLSKNNKNNFGYYEFGNMPIDELQRQLFLIKNENMAKYNIKNFNSNPWILVSASTKLILDKLQKQTNNMGETFKSIFQGIVTGIDEIYFLKRIKHREEEDIVEVYSERENGTISIEKDILKPILKGEDVTRYTEPDFNYYCIYPYKLVKNKTVILETDEFASDYPLAYKYLSKYKKELKNLRIKYKTNPKYWYSCHRGRQITLFDNERIITPEISNGCKMTLSNPNLYHNTQVYSFLPAEKKHENIKYWLGLFNSKIMWWFLSNTGTVLRGGYFRFKTKYLNPFPIRTINLDLPEDRLFHDRMVNLVEQMLQLHKGIEQVKTPDAEQRLQRQIEATDKQIDNLVYKLYDLTDEEIKIVEDNNR